MSDIIQITMTGRAGRDPELRYSQSGTAIAKFSIAATSGFGQSKKTIWKNVVVFGKRAEAIPKMVAKGLRVAVTGSLELEEWKDKKTGEAKSMEVVKATEVVPIDWPSTTHEQAEDAPTETSDQQPGEDDDVPF